MSRNLQAFNTNRRQFETGVLETKIFPFFLLSSKCANDFDNKISDYTFRNILRENPDGVSHFTFLKLQIVRQYCVKRH